MQWTIQAAKVSAARHLPLACGFVACLFAGACAHHEGKPEAAPAASVALEPARLDRLVARNTDPSVSLPDTLLAARLAAWHGLEIGARVARWADLFQRRGETTYLFGLKPGGYVTDSLLVQDFRQDCVLFSYRCAELAQASDPRDAVLRALATRFAGAPPDSVVSTAGGVDYDHPTHLDDSLDLVRSGFWGRDVTEEVGLAVRDSAGTTRYPPGSFAYIPSGQLRLDRLADGDLLYFVFDEKSSRGQKMRQEFGTPIGHQGIVSRAGDRVDVIHAAISDLPGEYQGNRVVRVALSTYLRRIESWKGVIVTRLAETTPRP